MDFKPREASIKINELMRLPQIIALTGLRRTGKTTLMLNIAYERIGEGLEPTNILYFSFDELKTATVLDIVGEYEKMLNKNLREGRYLFLFDEIQKLEGWEDKVKLLYDTYKSSVKIVISGSESLFIRKRSKENLAGRAFDVHVAPLSFKEYLIFVGQDSEPYALQEGKLAGHLNEFIKTQGFPELVYERSESNIRSYVDGIISTVLYKDIPSIFHVDKPDVLESMLRIMMNEPGQIIDFIKLAKEMKVSRHTVSEYSAYMEEAFLLRKLYNYSTNARKVERSLRKYYPTIIAPDLTFKEDNHYKSMVFEWLIVNQSNAEFFWRDQYKHEVDIVLRDGPVPVEVKYGAADTGSIIAFLKKFKVDDGYIVSLNDDAVKRIEERTIHAIPAAKLLSGLIELH